MLHKLRQLSVLNSIDLKGLLPTSVLVVEKITKTKQLRSRKKVILYYNSD